MQGKYSGAAEAYAEAIRLGGDRHHSHYALGSVYAYVGRWEKAASAFAGAAERAPGDMWSQYRLATLSFYLNDLESYRRACRAMLENFGETRNILFAERTAKACAIAPGFGGEAQKVIELANVAVTETEADPAHNWFEVTKALVDYRAGRFGPAARMIVQSAPSNEGIHRDALAFSILAMAQYRLGQIDEAKIALANARHIIAAKLPDTDNGQTFNDDWHDWLHAQLLYREANELLQKSVIESTHKSE